MIEKIIRAVLPITILFAGCAGIARAQDKPVSVPAPELNMILMESTFRIHGPKTGAPNLISFGTSFLMEKPTPERIGSAVHEPNRDVAARATPQNVGVADAAEVAGFRRSSRWSVRCRSG